MGTSRLTRILTISMAAYCGAETPLSAYDWSGWLTGGKEISQADFWEPAQTTTYAGEFQPEAQLEANIAKADNIMRVTTDEPDGKVELTVHKIYRYTPEDFAIYRQKVPHYADEQLALGHWVNKQFKEHLRDSEFVFDVERFYHHLETVAKGESWLAQLQRELLAIRLGVDVGVLENHPDFESFIKDNYLLNLIPYHQHAIAVTDDGIPELLVEDKLMPWTEFKKLVSLDNHGMATNYFYTYQGFVPGRPNSVIRPFKKVDPALYDHQHILEIISADIFPPHNWIRLVDPEGNMYSIGYWSTKPLKTLWGILQNLFPREGLVTSPDLMEVAVDPHKFLTTAIGISQGQFDDLLAYLQEYQSHPRQYEVLSTLGGENCATFVAQAAEHIGFKIKTASWMRPFNNPYDVMDWQEMVAKWRKKTLADIDHPTEQQKLDVDYGLPR